MRALVDLLFPATCAGCRRVGDVVCSDCAALLRRPARPRPPTPSPPSLPLPYAVADYADEVRALVLGFKEHEQVALTGLLAFALATSVTAACTDVSSSGVALVPVPSTRAARRRRGFDPVRRLAVTAARLLTAAGRPSAVVPLLRHMRVVRDSAGLTSMQRAANLDGAFAAVDDAARRVASRQVVLVDDVVTTGATLAEAARALRGRGVTVVASAVVAATVRKGGLAQIGLHNER